MKLTYFKKLVTHITNCKFQNEIEEIEKRHGNCAAVQKFLMIAATGQTESGWSCKLIEVLQQPDQPQHLVNCFQTGQLLIIIIFICVYVFMSSYFVMFH